MLRSTVSIVAGVISGVVILMAFQMASQIAFPMPTEMAHWPANKTAEYVRNLPWSAFALILSGWFFAMADGSLLAAWLSPQRPLFHAAFVSALFLLMAMWNLIANPFPFWMVLTIPFIGIAAFLFGGFVGKRLHHSRFKQ